MGTENIVVLRLYSGEMIIGKLNSFSDELSDMQYYELEDPRSIMMVPTMRGDVHIVLKLAITEDDCHSALRQRCPSFPR